MWRIQPHWPQYWMMPVCGAKFSVIRGTLSFCLFEVLWWWQDYCVHQIFTCSSTSQPPWQLEWSYVAWFWPKRYGCQWCKAFPGRLLYKHLRTFLPSLLLWWQLWRPHIPNIMSARWKRAGWLVLNFTWARNKPSCVKPLRWRTYLLLQPIVAHPD